MSISRKQLTVAGVFAVANAVLIPFSLTIVAILFSIAGSCYTPICTRNSFILLSLLVLISTIRYGFYCYVFLAFKKFINSQFQFHSANIFLSQAIWLNRVSVASTVVNFTFFFITFGSPESPFKAVGWVVLVSIGFYCLARILIGITYILLATEILRLSQILHDKPLESLARTLTFTGWLIATVLLAPLGFLLAVLADVLLGSIFLRRVRES
jgi:hypothetical protein